MSWDGKMYDKYRIEHADGTPLKGKKYFVLRLDSDDPVEAARVAAAMRAYKNEPRNSDVGTAEDQKQRFCRQCDEYILNRDPGEECVGCPLANMAGYCEFNWGQMPYEAERKGEGNGQ